MSQYEYLVIPNHNQNLYTPFIGEKELLLDPIIAWRIETYAQVAKSRKVYATSIVYPISSDGTDEGSGLIYNTDTEYLQENGTFICKGKEDVLAYLKGQA